MTAQRFALSLLVAIALVVLVASVGSSVGGDVAISGKLRYNALLQVGTDPPIPYEVSAQRYIVEAPPSTVGTVVPLDVDVVDSLCRDKDGCRVSLQMVNSEPLEEPGQVKSEEGWLFLSEISDWFRVGSIGSFDWKSIEGEDTSYDLDPYYLSTAEWRGLDCIFTQAETAGSGDNLRTDEGRGFGLLNCKNLGSEEDGGCSYDDDETTCRVLFID
jgi:hypothetical protein